MKSRRTVLQLISGVSLITLTGCVGSNESQPEQQPNQQPVATGESPSEPQQETNNTSDADTNTEDETEQTSTETSTESTREKYNLGSRSPTEVVRDYYQALDAGDEEKATALAHPDSLFYPIENGAHDNTTVEIITIEEIEPNEVPDKIDGVDSYTREDIENSFSDQIGYVPPEDSYAVIYADMRVDGERDPVIQRVVKTPTFGAWKVLR